MNEFRLVIHGEPISKGRPKFSVHGGRAFARTPARTRRYEDVIRQTAIAEWNGRPVLKDLALAVQATFYRTVPASWSKAKQRAALAGELRPVSRPDVENYVKACLDALTGVVWLDDSLVVELACSKHYGEQPRVEILLQWGAAE